MATLSMACPQSIPTPCHQTCQALLCPIHRPSEGKDPLECSSPSPSEVVTKIHIFGDCLYSQVQGCEGQTTLVMIREHSLLGTVDIQVPTCQMLQPKVVQAPCDPAP